MPTLDLKTIVLWLERDKLIKHFQVFLIIYISIVLLDV